MTVGEGWTPLQLNSLTASETVSARSRRSDVNSFCPVMSSSRPRTSPLACPLTAVSLVSPAEPRVHAPVHARVHSQRSVWLVQPNLASTQSVHDAADDVVTAKTIDVADCQLENALWQVLVRHLRSRRQQRGQRQWQRKVVYIQTNGTLNLILIPTLTLQLNSKQ